MKEQKLIGAVDTRWGSTYDMVKRILQQQQAVSAVLAEQRDSWHLMPTSEEVSTLEMLVKVLEPLSVLTDALSGEESVTGSAVRPILKHVLDTCKADHKDEPLVAEMGSRIECLIKRGCASCFCFFFLPLQIFYCSLLLLPELNRN